MDQILFTVFSVLAVISALLAVTRKNAVASACWLVIMFFGLAGVFVLEEAFLVATIQILVYAGAIMVLFLFVIMLLDLRSVELAAHAGPKLKIAGVVLAGGFLAAVLYALEDASASPRIADRVGAVLVRPPPPIAAAKSEPTSANDPTGADAGSPDPLATVEAPKAPPPQRLDLAPAATWSVTVGENMARAHPPIGEAPADPAVPELSGDRAFVASFATDTTSMAVPSRHLVVSLRPEGGVEVWIDGTRTPSPTWTTSGREQHASVPVPDAPAGTAIELTVIRGGLEASPGGGPDGSARAIGRSLFEDFLLPFEIVSILLTGAIFGAVVLTKRRLS